MPSQILTIKRALRRDYALHLHNHPPRYTTNPQPRGSPGASPRQSDISPMGKGTSQLPSDSMSSKALRLVIIAGTLIAFSSIALSRERYLYPGAFECLTQLHGCSFAEPQAGTEERYITTSDGARLRMWRSVPGAPERGHALIFGGDAGRIEMIRPIAEWFHSLGFSTTIFDYRGFGKSSGWPSETGIYRDVEALAGLVRDIPPQQLVVFGTSFGACPAAYAASLLTPKLLAIVSGYTDFPSVDREIFWLPPLVSLAWPQFPTTNFISRLTHTDLLLFHGERDFEIPPSHSRALLESYRGDGNHELVIAAQGTHRSALSLIQKQFQEDLVRSFPLPTP